MSEAVMVPGAALLPRLTRMLVDHLGIEPAQAQPSARLVDDLGCDSLDCFDLTMSAECLFGCTITDAEAEACRTVADMLALLAGKGVAP